MNSSKKSLHICSKTKRTKWKDPFLIWIYIKCCVNNIVITCKMYNRRLKGERLWWVTALLSLVCVLCFIFLKAVLQSFTMFSLNFLFSCWSLIMWRHVTGIGAHSVVLWSFLKCRIPFVCLMTKALPKIFVVYIPDIGNCSWHYEWNQWGISRFWAFRIFGFWVKP